MKEPILKFIKKYPLTMVAILSFAAIAIAEINLGDIYTITAETNTINELLLLSLNMIFATFLFYKIADIYIDKLPQKIRHNTIIKHILVLFVSLIIYLLSRLLFNLYMEDGIYGIYNLLLLYIALTYYLIIRENDIEVHEYLVKVFMNTLFLFLIYCIVASGIGVLIYIYMVLFGDLNWKIIMYIYIFITAVIGYVGYFISIDYVEQKISVFSKVLLKYIMMMMVLIGFVFFYIYLIQIIVSGKLPSNQVFGVCTLLFSVGLSIALMSRSFEGNKYYDNVIKYLPIAFIPALILQNLSIYLRIKDYGMTMTRYTGLIVIIFEIVYLIFYFRKYEKLRAVFLAQAILVLVLGFIPFINQYQFPKIYNSIFH